MDILSFLRTIAALGIVLGLLVGALWAIRRYNIVLPGQSGGRTGRRVALIERVGIDARRSIILVRRDDREHLIMVAPDGQTVIESNIVREEIEIRASDEAVIAPAVKVQEDFATLVDMLSVAGAKAKGQARAALAKGRTLQRSAKALGAARLGPAKTSAPAPKGKQDLAAFADLVNRTGAKARAALLKDQQPLAPPEATPVATPKAKRPASPEKALSARAKAKPLAPPRPKRPAVVLKVTAADGRTVVEPISSFAAIPAAQAA